MYVGGAECLVRMNFVCLCVVDYECESLNLCSQLFVSVK